MGPEHAKLIADSGWTKEDFRKALWEGVRVRVGAYPKAKQAKAAPYEEEFGPFPPERLIPMTTSPDLIHIVIAGGTGKHSHYFPNYSGEAVSKLVTK